MNLSVYLAIFIPLFGGVALLAFNSFKIFHYYLNHFYIATSLILTFMLGWNLSLLYSNANVNIIDWWFILCVSVFLLYLFIIYKMSHRKYYDLYGHEW